MYEFLGAVMGCSVRTKNFLNLDLPSIIWKQLVDMPVNRKDLENIDRYTIQVENSIFLHYMLFLVFRRRYKYPKKRSR